MNEVTKRTTREMAQTAAYIREMRPYYQSAEKLIQDMVNAGTITLEDSLNRRADLLSRVTGAVIDVKPTAPASPQVNTMPQSPEPAVDTSNTRTPKSRTAPYAPRANIDGPVPGNLPIKGATITPVVDDEGFCSARSIATALGEAVKPIIVGKMARALGIYGITNSTNEWGFYLPLEQNNKKIADNWRYSAKSQQILMATLLEYIEKKRASSPRTRAGEVIAEVVAKWPGYPIEAKPEETPAMAPN